MLNGGSGLHAVLPQIFSIGIWYWISVSLAAMGIAAFDTFTQFGATIGTTGSPNSFLIPSQVWQLGWDAARPLLRVADTYSGWSVLWNFFTIAIFYLSALALILAYGFMAFFIMLVQIEFRLGLMLSAILLPLGVYQGTAFMAEFGLGMLCASLVRTFITTALLALSGPLIQLVVPQLAPNGDPTFETAIVMAFVSVSYVLLLLSMARKASTLAVRGLGLGLGSQMSLGNIAGGAAMALGPAGRLAGAAASGAMRGGSRLVQAMRS